ncbi:MAG: beta-ketoacyl-[acyl-carrier-protein] synthase family protein, partial [Deltaproteobacteria bacterium]|nr:beta-ketoacyl-[acyl-carrier-protein] synthase family protein [Deltaproteobacteria bacterium]
MKRRVVITGMGLVTPLGCRLQEFGERLLSGESAAAPITLFDPASFPTTIAAEVNDARFKTDFKDRKVLFAVASARDAVMDSQRTGMTLKKFYDKAPCFLSLGTGLELFSMPDMLTYRKNQTLPASDTCHPLCFIQTPSDISVHKISLEHDLTWPPQVHVSACAASTDAIGRAFMRVRGGDVAYALAGGTDAMINPMGVGGFCRIQAMTTKNKTPKVASRPFDRDRDGFLLGEGAAVFVLESLESAAKRGAPVFAEIAGYGNAMDAYGISEPDPMGSGAVLAMRRAIYSAGITPQSIVHVSAHGTSTPKNDPVETCAIRTVFGGHADDLTVNATKSMIGHLIAASGAVEV